MWREHHEVFSFMDESPGLLLPRKSRANPLTQKNSACTGGGYPWTMILHGSRSPTRSWENPPHRDTVRLLSQLLSLSLSDCLLREIFKGDFLVAWEAIFHSAAYGLYTTCPNSEGNDRADYNATDPTECNPFQEETVTKKCHRRHLFYASLLQIHNCLCLTPEVFKSVILALLRSKDMHYDTAKI